MINLYNGDCLAVLKTFPDNSVESLITDPPAGISFMNKSWDDDKGGRDQWIAWMTEVMRECLRVMKPGAHGLVWAIPRTSHWTGAALEQAGFEVRDVITHLFGTGFPKSLDISKAIDKAAGAIRTDVIKSVKRSGPTQAPESISRGNIKPAGTPKLEYDVCEPATPEAKQWEGWGTALKPASEHWILVRKPLSESTVAKNVLKWGTGGINIDAGRIGTDVISTHDGGDKMSGMKGNGNSGVGEYKSHVGRFPANLVLDEEAAAALDASTIVSSGAEKGASRFFYVAKASKADKNNGLEEIPDTIVDDGRDTPIDNPYLRGKTGRKNTHPTVKSTKLMEYLIKLITPPGGVVLDPFMGSGSTGVACETLGLEFVGIEKEAEYFAIAEKRTGVK